MCVLLFLFSFLVSFLCLFFCGVAENHKREKRYKNWLISSNNLHVFFHWRIWGWGSKGPCPPPPLRQIGIYPFLYCFYAFGLGLEVRDRSEFKYICHSGGLYHYPNPIMYFFIYLFFFFFFGRGGGGGVGKYKKKMCQSPFSPPPPPLPFRAAASSWHSPPIVQTPHWD